MTTAQDYRAWKAAEEARKALPKLLRETSATGLASHLMGEAADALEHYELQISKLRKEMADNDRAAQHEIRDAVAETRWQAAQGHDHGGF